jgi:two-component system chemotaxis response regulator CheB
MSRRSMPVKRRQIQALVIGASAGGIDALLRLLPGLHPEFRFPVVVVLHLPEDRDSRLAEVFQQHLPMPVLQAQDKEMLLPGRVYFAPPGYHLSIETERCFSLSQEEPVHFSRPSIDVMMASAADAYGADICAILLTGASSDGADGLAAIGEAGGLTIVQDPQDAEISTMPAAAIRKRQPAMILPLREMTALLAKLETM